MPPSQLSCPKCQSNDVQRHLSKYYCQTCGCETQKAISALFDVDRMVVTKHLKNIFESGELMRESVCANFAHTDSDGKSYSTNFYSLDAVISVGYRVNSTRATKFRQWATAAELIVDRASAGKEHMGLTSWENAPHGKIVKTDVSIVKNYLEKNELEILGRIVNAFLELAENKAKRHIPMTMEDWSKHIDRFLSMDDYQLLQGNGKVTADEAKEYAESEFEKYRRIQDQTFQSDFDKFLQELD